MLILHGGILLMSTVKLKATCNSVMIHATDLSHSPPPGTEVMVFDFQ